MKLDINIYNPKHTNKTSKNDIYKNVSQGWNMIKMFQSKINKNKQYQAFYN